MARARGVPNEKSVPVARCTACRAMIKTTFDAYLHPLLSVLICRKCYKDYGDGDFSLLNDPDVGPGIDEAGDDNYCRWCVDGGQLCFCTDGSFPDDERCTYAFCKKCIKKNIPEDPILTPAEKEPGFKWKCLVCDPSKLKAKRLEAQEAIKTLSAKELKRPAMKAANLIAAPREQVTTASDYNLKDLELKRKLESFKKVANICSAEIDSKFETIVEMFLSKDLEHKSSIKIKLEDIKKPIQEFNTMLMDLESLYSSGV